MNKLQRRQISFPQRDMLVKISQHKSPIAGLMGRSEHGAAGATLKSLIAYGFVVYAERDTASAGEARYGLTIEGIRAVEKIEKGQPVWTTG